MSDTSREEFERLLASGELFEQFAAMRVQLAEQDEQFLLRVRERGEILRQLFIKEYERESAAVALRALQPYLQHTWECASVTKMTGTEDFGGELRQIRPADCDCGLSILLSRGDANVMRAKP